MFNKYTGALICLCLTKIRWGINFPVFNQYTGALICLYLTNYAGALICLCVTKYVQVIDVINCNCLNYFSEINIITLGSFIHSIALLTSEKLTLRISLRDEAGEIRCAKQILAIETKRIKAKSLGFNENASY